MPQAKSFSAVSTIQDLSSNLRKSDIELMISFCWVAWYARNKFIFEGKKIDPRLSAAKAESVVQAFQRARKAGATHIHNARKVQQQKWEPPPKSAFKINVDAAINSKGQVAGLGAVIEDSNSKIVAAGIKQTRLKENVSFAEAEAIEWGLKVARRAALSSLIVETDCLEVAEPVNKTKGSRTGIRWIIAKNSKFKKRFP